MRSSSGPSPRPHPQAQPIGHAPRQNPDATMLLDVDLADTLHAGAQVRRRFVQLRLDEKVAGSLLGTVGVSGAPGGDLDEACALMGVEAVQERIDFPDD